MLIFIYIRHTNIKRLYYITTPYREEIANNIVTLIKARKFIELYRL